MRKQTRGIGTYIIILAIIVLVMFLSDNLYKMNRNNYNFDSANRRGRSYTRS